jgi:hypothetical protein
MGNEVSNGKRRSRSYVPPLSRLRRKKKNVWVLEGMRHVAKLEWDGGLQLRLAIAASWVGESQCTKPSFPLDFLLAVA